MAFRGRDAGEVWRVRAPEDRQCVGRQVVCERRAGREDKRGRVGRLRARGLLSDVACDGHDIVVLKVVSRECLRRAADFNETPSEGERRGDAQMMCAQRRTTTAQERHGEHDGDEHGVVGDELLVVQRLERAPRDELLVEDDEGQQCERCGEECLVFAPVEESAPRAEGQRA